MTGSADAVKGRQRRKGSMLTTPERSCSPAHPGDGGGLPRADRPPRSGSSWPARPRTGSGTCGKRFRHAVGQGPLPALHLPRRAPLHRPDARRHLLRGPDLRHDDGQPHARRLLRRILSLREVRLRPRLLLRHRRRRDRGHGRRPLPGLPPLRRPAQGLRHDAGPIRRSSTS
ncbi:MAG: hypothetical protein M0C28_04440 [Candidatus Moduliflexus flocculans]|nr:hypothetical protein [Candidatus Moduliflexus flocculans]